VQCILAPAGTESESSQAVTSFLLWLPCADSAVSKQQVKQRQKDVIARVGNIVMRHVVGTSEAETGRQPSVHMYPPVNFFGGNQIHSPTNEDAGGDLEAEQKIYEEHDTSIAGEQNGYVRRRLSKRNVFGLIRSADMRMVLEMSFAEGTTGPVQQPAMVCVLEPIGPYQTDDQAQQPAIPMKWKIEGQYQTREGAG
jgi:hypothetical protein